MCHPESPDAPVPDVSSREVTVDLADGTRMGAFLAMPSNGTPRGAVVVIGDIWGARTAFYEHLARLLAERGSAALVPEVFHRVGALTEQTYDAALARKHELDELQALADLEAALESARSHAASPVVGVVGFCMGGTFALDLAARRDDLATVCYYGFPAGSPGPPSERIAPSPLDQADAISGPILGFWGALDERAGMQNVAALAEALRSRGVAFEHQVLADLDHGFLATAFEPGADGHDAAVATWQRTLGFLDSHLAGA
jgi:carboxymethylenebutenolidase